MDTVNPIASVVMILLAGSKKGEKSRSEPRTPKMFWKHVLDEFAVAVLRPRPRVTLQCITPIPLPPSHETNSYGPGVSGETGKSPGYAKERVPEAVARGDALLACADGWRGALRAIRHVNAAAAIATDKDLERLSRGKAHAGRGRRVYCIVNPQRIGK